MFEAAEDFPYFEGLSTNIIQRIVRTHELQIAGPVSRISPSLPDDTSPNHNLQLIPLSFGIKLHKPHDILTQKYLRIEIFESIVLLIEELVHHAKQQV